MTDPTRLFTGRGNEKPVPLNFYVRDVTEERNEVPNTRTTAITSERTVVWTKVVEGTRTE